jgi:hypothetical protein
MRLVSVTIPIGISSNWSSSLYIGIFLPSVSLRAKYGIFSETNVSWLAPHDCVSSFCYLLFLIIAIYEYLALISLIFLDCEFDRISHAPPQIAEILSRLLLLFVSVGGMMEQCDPQVSVGTVITSYKLKNLSIFFTSVFVIQDDNFAYGSVWV